MFAGPSRYLQSSKDIMVSYFCNCCKRIETGDIGNDMDCGMMYITDIWCERGKLKIALSRDETPYHHDMYDAVIGRQ